jgi:enamine deaminase RidA (YjgF/YER057c/UK114 family)
MVADTSDQDHSGDAPIGIVRSDKLRAPRVSGSTGRRRSVNLKCLSKGFPMLARFSVYFGLALSCMLPVGMAQSPSPNGVKALNPPGAISAGGDTWSVASRAGDFIFVAGMQGINPSTNKLVDGDEARIRQAFLNLKFMLSRRAQRFRIACASRSTYRTCTASHRSSAKYRPNFGASHLILPERCLRCNASLMMTSLRSIVFFTLQQRNDKCPSYV